MTWNEGTTASSDAYRDLHDQIIDAMTSHSVATVTVNSGGSGYVVGEIITLTHAGAVFDAEFEVTTVSSGAVTGLAIRKGGAFADRVASVTIGAGGTGYSVGDEVALTINASGGTVTGFRHAKFTVDTVSGSSVTAVSLLGNGGSYGTVPVGNLPTETIDGGSGSILTLDPTMTGLIGTTGLATSASASGTGLTVDITLDAPSWTALRDSHDGNQNGVTDERVAVLEGTVAGADAPIVSMLTFTRTDGAVTNHGIAMFSIDSYNDSEPNLDNQVGFGPGALALTSGAVAVLPVFEAAREFGFSVTGRRVCGWLRTTDVTVCYGQFYLGFGNQLETATAYPYPMVVAGCSNEPNRRPDAAQITGLSECYQEPTGAGPVFYRRKTTGNFASVVNARSTGVTQDVTMFPLGRVRTTSAAILPTPGAFDQLGQGTLASNTRTNPARAIRPVPGSAQQPMLWPLLVVNSQSSTNDGETQVVCELDGVYWFGGILPSGSETLAAQKFLVGGVQYTAIPNGTQGVAGKPYQFTVFEES